MMKPPTFSLIVATVNRTVELGTLFNSLSTQTYSDFEVIVVDQNNDGRLQPYLDQADALGLKLIHLKHRPANLSAARNVGLKAASAELIGFPDDDCWYEPDLLERIASRFCATDSPSGVSVRWLEEGDPSIEGGMLSWERSKAFRDIPVSSITLFFRRMLFEQIGDFDVRFGAGQWFGAGEETDFVLRALRAGAVIAYEPSAIVHHPASSPKYDSQSLLSIRHRARGTGALWAKHGLPLWVRLRGLVAPVLRPLLRGSFGAEMAHGCSEMRGRLDGWLGWKRMQP